MSSTSFTEEGINIGVLRQLNFLEAELHAGAAHRMQQLFPEGHLFTNALYGLTWADAAAGAPAGPLRERALGEIDWALSEIQSPAGRAVFSPDLPLPYGVFYQGWSTYLLGKKLQLAAPEKRDTTELRQYREQTTMLAAAFAAAKSPFLESYRNAVWPADNVIGMAALMEADQLFGEHRFAALRVDWLQKVRQRLDPQTGLIPHHTAPYTGELLEGARGSSQSLMLSFLPAIDSVFAVEQYTRYETYFVDSRLGLTGIREYPVGSNGTGDIDSGPVIWGIGGAASVVGQRAAALQGRPARFVELRNALGAFGMAYSWSGKKRYLFGQLTVADAFIAWANAAEQREGQFRAGWWQWEFQLYSLAFAALLVWLFRKL